MTAFATIPKVVQHLTTIDGSGYDVTIILGEGTWTGESCEGSDAVLRFKGLVGMGYLKIYGMGSNTIIDGENKYRGILATGNYRHYQLGNMTFDNCTYGINSTNGNRILINQPVTIGYCSGAQLASAHDGILTVRTDFTVVAGSTRFLYSTFGGYIYGEEGTVTFLNMPDYTVAVVSVYDLALINLKLVFNGEARGIRYLSSGNAVINTGRAGEDYIPGNSAGLTSTGGQYI